MPKVILGLLLALVSFSQVASRRRLDNTLKSLCAQSVNQSKPVLVRGNPETGSQGHFQLNGAQIWVFGRWLTMPGVVRLGFGLKNPLSGHLVEIWGYVKCPSRLENPGAVADGLLRLAPANFILTRALRIRLDRGRSAWLSQARLLFEGWWQPQFQTVPGILGFERALWTGDSKALPSDLLRFYREGGLLPILALSGQHVGALFLCISLLQWLPFYLARKWWPRPAGWFLCRWQRVLPVVCAGILYVTSGGAPSMLRTLAMALSLGFLKLRGLHGNTLQILASSIALLIIWDFTNITSISFLLSVGATAISLLVLTEIKLWQKIRVYFFISLTLPILMAPLTSFFFAKISLLAPLYQILLAWVWDLILIPLGFLLPLFVTLLPPPAERVLLGWLEQAWDNWLAFHRGLEQWVGNYYCTTIRLTWLELAVIELALLLLMARVARNLSARV